MTKKRLPAAWALLERWEATGTPRDLIAQLDALAADDDLDAISVLVLIYEEGRRDRSGAWFVRPDRRAVASLHERGVELGDAGLMTSLADSLSSSPRASAAAIRRAVQLYRRASLTGYSTAAFNLACMYRNRGRYREAVTWFRRAHAAGDPSALFDVALAELYGTGTRRDPKAAVDKLRRVTRSKITYIPANWHQCEAMLLLSQIYDAGWLVRHDYRASLRWLRRAARLGSPRARAMLTG